MLRRLLELEVPEIANGTVDIRAIAREAGQRSKVSVAALQPGIDPVGACVGMKGTRIQSIVNELNGEKIDIVPWSPDDALYVSNALSPAKVIETLLEGENDEGKTAIVVVPDKQLSLAIGKEGQNARLAAKLTGWRIDIKSASEASEERVRLAEREANRREADSRKRADEEAKLVAARALLEEAEGVTDTQPDEELMVMSIADQLAFGIPAIPMDKAPTTEDKRDDGRRAQPTEQPTIPVEPKVERDERAQPAAQPMPTEPVQPRPQAQPLPAQRPAAQTQPSSQPRPQGQPQPGTPAARPQAQPPAATPARPAAQAQPTTAPRPAAPKPPVQQPVVPVVEDFDDDDDDDVEDTAKKKGAVPSIFYTLNSRGEAESLDDTLERRKREKDDRRGKKKGGGGSSSGGGNRGGSSGGSSGGGNRSGGGGNRGGGSGNRGRR
jgi:transcription antitermination factor NusA-like protein